MNSCAHEYAAFDGIHFPNVQDFAAGASLTTLLWRMVQTRSYFVAPNRCSCFIYIDESSRVSGIPDG